MNMLEPHREIYRPLLWRQVELTLEDCRAFKRRNQYHFSGGSSRVFTAMDWAEISIDLRLWIECSTFAEMLEVFGMGDPADLEKMRGFLIALMDGDAVTGEGWKRGKEKQGREKL